MNSIWTETVIMPQFSKMTAPQKTDVLIIGGGITGILCAYFLLKELNALEKIGYSASYEENINLPFQTAGAIRFENQAQFHPLKFISGIAKNLQIFEKTFVKELAPHTAKTTCGEITFDKLIVATHFPIDNKHGMYSLKMYQHRTYVIALKDRPRIDGMYVDEAMKCGITSSMVSAGILTDLILEKYNPYAEIFNPSRNMLKPQLFINTGEAVLNLLSFSRKRCPHLGCSLKWNPDEHSWDCPCHGSRFTEHGKLLDNPANGDADWK